MTEAPLTGGCLCGQLRYEARGPAINVRACHCRACQRAASAPFFVRAVFPTEAVSWSGDALVYRSSARLNRISCAVCGSLIFGAPIDRPQFIGLAVASLDDPDALAPDRHIWTSSKQAWLRLDDGLPQHAEGVPW